MVQEKVLTSTASQLSVLWITQSYFYSTLHEELFCVNKDCRLCPEKSVLFRASGASNFCLTLFCSYNFN